MEKTRNFAALEGLVEGRRGPGRDRGGGGTGFLPVPSSSQTRPFNTPLSAPRPRPDLFSAGRLPFLVFGKVI